MRPFELINSICFVLGLLIAIGCSGDQNKNHSYDFSPLEPPITLKVRQRSTTAVPSSKDRLLLTVDDVTRNQVQSSLSTNSGLVILPVRSFSPKDFAVFRYADTDYTIRLDSLQNELIDEDHATFIISTLSSSASELNEDAKIEALILHVRSLEGGTFIRNNESHSAPEAADHLRAKWNASGGKITSAKQFIDEIASTSSSSGEAYFIKLPSGETLTARDYLKGELAKLENGSQ